MAVKKSAAKKVAKKKVVAKKPAVKKVVKKTAAVKKAPAAVKKVTVVKEAYTKTQMLKAIADHTKLTKKQVGSVLDALVDVIHSHVKKGSVGSIKIEGLLKIEKIMKPARKARKGVNPLTGEEMMFKAKPAHNVVKVRALKKLKGMIE
jgi:nucleoid DNA-binding protein